jgi:hypothetical protein
MVLLGSLTELREVAQGIADLARFAFRRIGPEDAMEIPRPRPGQSDRH